MEWTQLCLAEGPASLQEDFAEVLLVDAMFAAAFSSPEKWISEAVCKYVATKVPVKCKWLTPTPLNSQSVGLE